MKRLLASAAILAAMSTGAFAWGLAGGSFAGSQSQAGAESVQIGGAGTIGNGLAISGGVQTSRTTAGNVSAAGTLGIVSGSGSVSRVTNTNASSYGSFSLGNGAGLAGGQNASGGNAGGAAGAGAIGWAP